MRTLTARTTIEAPPERVWAELMDFARWHEWNPFVPSIEGAAEEGARLRVRLVPPGGRGSTFRPVVTAVEPARRFAWRGSVGVRGVADGHHAFELEPAGDGATSFLQHEEFSGAAVGLLWPLLRKAAPGFVAMNAALKERVEARGRSALRQGGGDTPAT